MPCWPRRLGCAWSVSELDKRKTPCRMFWPEFADSFRRRQRSSPTFTCQTLLKAASIRAREKQSAYPGLTAIRAPRHRVRAPSGRSSRWWVHLSSTSPTTLPVRSFCSACCWDALYAAFCARLAGFRSCFIRFPAKVLHEKAQAAHVHQVRRAVVCRGAAARLGG